MTMGKILNFIVGAIIGGLVGSAVATLLAPSSGDELQGKVKEYTLNLKEEVAKAREARRGELEEQLAKLRKPAA
jgi:gas vesicle protein